VDEIVDYGVVTVKALGRLECRYERTNTPEHEVLHTSRSLSSIASQLSRVESPLSVGAGSASSPVAPTYAGLPGLARTGSTSSLYGIYSDSPVMASGSRWNSTSELPIGASKDKCQVGQLCRLSKDEVEILERHFQEEHKPSSNTKRQLAGRMGAEISRINVI
jgi:hypothetical protein